MNIEFLHKRSTLMSRKKEELVRQIMYLEHNNNALNEMNIQQAKNFEKLEKQAIKDFADKVLNKIEALESDELGSPAKIHYNSGLEDAMLIIEQEAEKALKEMEDRKDGEINK